MPRLPHAVRRAAAALALAAALPILVACGSEGDPAADPASVVPAGAPVYLEARVRPEGELAENFRAVAGRLLGRDDPGSELRRLFDEAVADEQLTYEEDVEPWLGERVGFFVSDLRGRDDVEGALVFSTSDPGDARDALEEGLGRIDGRDTPVETRSHRDVDYRVAPRADSALARLGDLVVIGTERAVRGAIDAHEQRPLSEARGYSQARDAVEGERLGVAWVDLGRFVDAIARTSDVPAAQLAPLRQALARAGADGLIAALDVERDLIRVETAAPGARGAGGGDDGGAAELLRSLPADAWLAVGIGDLGGSLKRGLDAAGRAGAFGGVDVDDLLGGLRRSTGLDVRRDLLAWMGDAAVFVRGTGLSDLGGALVVRSDDPARSRGAVPRLAALARRMAGARTEPLRREGVDRGATVRADGVPLPIHLAAAGERFVVAAGDAALRAALTPDRALSANPRFRAVSGALSDGVRPALFVDVEPIVRLASGLGAGGDPRFDELRRVLDALTGLAAGSRRDGDVQRGELVVGVERR